MIISSVIGDVTQPLVLLPGEQWTYSATLFNADGESGSEYTATIKEDSRLTLLAAQQNKEPMRFNIVRGSQDQ